MQPIHLLLQADVEWLGPTEPLDRVAHVVILVAARQLRLKRLDHAQHCVLARLAAAAAALLRLHVEHSAKNHLRLRSAVDDVGVGMQPKDGRCVDERQLLDVLAVHFHLHTKRDPVDVVEAEGCLEDRRVHPRRRVPSEARAVKIVRDPAAILHVADHVAQAVPVDRPFATLDV